MLSRRGFLLGLGGLTASTGLVALTSGCSSPARPPRIAVATNEPWGTYHVESMLAQVAAAGGALALVVPDTSEIEADDETPTVLLDELADWDADLLVVNGATEWPVEVATAAANLRLVASSFAYLTPEEAPGAASIRDRLAAATAASSDEAAVFAAHLGITADDVAIVGNPALDDVPSYDPQAGEIVIATSVTVADDTGDAAPGAQVLLDTAAALAEQGQQLRIGLHPREDPTLWADFETADEGTLEASTRASTVVGNPGSIFTQIAAVGAPLVGIVAEGLETPDYILRLCREARDVDTALAAVTEAWRPDDGDLEATIGPVGGSAERLWAAWAQAR